MKKVFLLLTLLITSSGFAKTINDQTCEVAVSKASLKKVLSNGRSVLLHSDKTTGSENLVDRLFARFPKCNY